MNEWGFIVVASNGKVLFEDFGYETEADAYEFGEKFIREWAEGASLVVEQRWQEIGEDDEDDE